AAIQIAKTEKGASDILTEDQEIKLLQKLVKQRKDALEIYEKENREDLAQKEREEIKVIERFLPQQMSQDELRSELKKIIEQVGVTGPQDMGKVMGAATKAFAGRADGKTISATVKELLS
ncbi:MAG TPA: GatB/YqeY domain-containing protein, partial [Chitinophagales bacterium]|nr:GatB/YqeY domain-containing protein [Chitinophagales bacterium]